MTTHRDWIDLAETLGKNSKHRNAQVGCVLVSAENEKLAVGWNRVPTNVQDLDVRYGTENGLWVLHAERNAIYSAAREGIALAGATAYINYSPQSICTNCVRALIQSGVVRFVGPERALRSRTHYTPRSEVARTLVAEAGIQLLTV